jgi:hypothetical protein
MTFISPAKISIKCDPKEKDNKFSTQFIYISFLSDRSTTIKAKAFFDDFKR